MWDSTLFGRAKVSMGLYYKTGLTIQCTCGTLWCTCGVLVQFLPVWDSSAHVGLQCPCGTLPFLEELKFQWFVLQNWTNNSVHVWGASASRVACWFSFCPCGTPVPMWGSSAHVGHWCTCGVPRLHVWRAGSVFAHVGLQCPCGAPVPMWDTGARVGCLGFTCGVLVQFLPMWDSSAHVGLQCPCGTLVHVWGASASRVAEAPHT